MGEYIVYQSNLVPVGKGQLPNVIYEYVSETLPHVTLTKELEEAYRFSLSDAEEMAYLLSMKLERSK